MRFATIWCSFLHILSMVLPSVAAPVVLSLSDTLKYPVHLNPYAEAYFSPVDYLPNVALAKIQNGEMSKSQAHTSPGFSRDIYWIRFTIEAQNEGEFLIELDNPHIDHVYLYELRKDQPVMIGRGGDKHTFDFRSIENRRYLFAVNLRNNQATEYLLMVDKRNAAVSFPLRIWPEAQFYQAEQTSNFVYGLYFGILLFIASFSLLIGAALKEKNFLSYALYVLIVSLYMFTQLGFSFQYLYPFSDQLNNYTRVFLSFAFLMASVDFFSRLLEVEIFVPRMLKYYSRLLWFLLVMNVIWGLCRIFMTNYHVLTIFLLNLLYGIIFLFFISVFYVCYKTWKVQQGNVILVLSAFFALMLGTVAYIMVEYGVLNESLFPINPVMIGSMIEIIILSVSMTYRVKVLNDRRKELADKLLTQQKGLMRAYIRGGDVERQRISAELHDNVGSYLSLLKSKISKADFNTTEVAGEIDNLCQTVRDLSHKLVPHHMHMMSFSEMIGDYCQKFQKSSGIKVSYEFYDMPEINENIATPLFRIIQEAFQNVLKHAKATQIEMQLVGYENELVLTIDDNGNGFISGSVTSGNGLINMKIRAEAMHAHMEISSQPGYGTNIILSVPIRKNVEMA